jgi:hypothetical protein
MRDQGVLVACDRTRNKVLPVLECCTKFALTRGAVAAEQFLFACKTDSSKANVESTEDWSEASSAERKRVLLAYLATLSRDEHNILALPSGSLPRGVFDRVVVDAPCSSLGLRPRFSHISVSVKALEDMSVVQKRILFNAVLLTRVGGFISYSTCTFNPLENELVVRWALELFKTALRLVPVEPACGQPGLTSILSPADANMVQRFDPSNIEVDSIGFFIAKFEKVASTSHVCERVWIE